MERLENGEITDALRCEIVSSIAVRIYEICTYPKPEEYTTICKRLIEKYPILKDTYGNGYVRPNSQVYVTEIL